VDWNTDGRTEQCQLLCCRGATWVGGDKEWTPPLSLQAKRKLCSGGGLSCSLKAEQQNARWPLTQIKFAT